MKKKTISKALVFVELIDTYRANFLKLLKRSLSVSVTRTTYSVTRTTYHYI